MPQDMHKGQKTAHRSHYSPPTAQGRRIPRVVRLGGKCLHLLSHLNSQDRVWKEGTTWWSIPFLPPQRSNEAEICTCRQVVKH